MATLSNALAGMSLGGGNDWGNPDGKPIMYTAKLEGFAPVQQDIFYFFNEHPNLPTIADEEIEDIVTIGDESEEAPLAHLILRSRDAALRALNFSHQIFDGREIIVTVDGLSLEDDTPQQPPQEEQPVAEPEPQRPVPVEQPPPAARQEAPPQANEAAPSSQPPSSTAWKPRKPRDDTPAAPSQDHQPEQQHDGGRGGGGGGGNYGVGGYNNDRGNDRSGGGGYDRRDNYGNRSGGGGYDNRGGDRGGYGSGYGRRDEGDRRQGGGYGMGGGGGGPRYGSGGPRGGDDTLEMDADALAAASSGRPRLNLKKRTGGAAKASSRPAARPAPSRSSIFGNAKPREEVLKAKGVDPNAVRPARKEQHNTSSIRGGGNKGNAPPQMDKKAPPVVKNENVFDVLNAD